MTRQMARGAVLAIAFAFLALTQAVAREVVLPVVTKRVAGAQGSVWETRVQVLRVSTDQDVVVRRSWVALPGGGFVDDPATAPTWVLQVNAPYPYMSHAALVLTGEELLEGVSATQGAVGLEVTGEALIQGRIADAGSGPPPPDYLWTGITYGAGQLVPVASPLQGAAVLPWGGPVIDCWSSQPRPFSFRTNVGLVNPNVETLRIEIRGIAYNEIEERLLFAYPRLQPVLVDLPPLGWVQLNDLVREIPWLGGGNPWGDPPCQLGVFFAFNLVPHDAAAPYYAYLSVVYSDRNDPELILAVPGQLPEGPEHWIPLE